MPPVEPEAAEPYALALRMDGALAVLTVGGHLATGEVLPSEDRERDFGDMVEAAFG
jgi:purine-nucleoside phosphorylase